MLISCPHQQFNTSTYVKIHSFNVPLQGFLCQFQFLEFTPLRYEQQKRLTYIGTVHQHFQYFDISRGCGDRVRLRLIPERDRELVPHVCSYHMIKQWLSIGWGLSRDYLSGKLFVGVEIIKCASWYAEALCILYLRVDVYSSLAQVYCYNVICI